MGQVLRWGILGAAKIAASSVAPAIHAATRNELSAIASRDLQKATRFTERYPSIRVHQTYDELLDHPHVDAVYIPLPNDMHVPWSLKAIGAGKHVLCEKPIALTSKDIDDLIEARDLSGLLVAEAFMVLHHPQWRRVKQLVGEGAIGQLRQVDGVFSYNNSNDPDNIRQKPEHGGGALHDIGVYPIITTRFVSQQEPIRSAAQKTYQSGVDTTSRVEVEFESFMLNFYCSMRMAGRQEMVFHGTSGWIRVQAPFNAQSYDDTILEIRSGQLRTIERFSSANQYQLMIEAFQQAAEGNQAFVCPLEFSKGNQQVVDQLLA